MEVFIASLVMMWCLPWTLMVTDSPLDHPHISSKERDYIADSLMGMVSLDRVSNCFNHAELIFFFFK